MKFNLKFCAPILLNMVAPLMAAECSTPIEVSGMSSTRGVSSVRVPENIALEKRVDNFLKTTPLEQNSRLIIDYAGGFIDWDNPGNPITAAQRFGYVLDLLVQAPTLTMEDKRAEITKLYKKDETFIRIATLDRTPEVSAKINSQLTKLARMVESEMGELSFSDLNCVGAMWTKIIGQQFFDENYWGSYHGYLNRFKLRGIKPEDTGFFHGKYIGARSIILPHVSKTGAVPIRVFNEGYGFSVTPTLLRSIDWLGVGTNERLDFDYIRGANSFNNWYHDYEHTNRSSRFGIATNMNPRTENIGRLRAQMKLMPSGESSSQAELAFFYTFHESQVEQEEITSYLGRVIANLSQQLEKGLTLDGSGFSSPGQFETDIAGAKSLGLAVEGETLLERQKAFLKHRIAGYKILQSLAHYHDVEG